MEPLDFDTVRQTIERLILHFDHRVIDKIMRDLNISKREFLVRGLTNEFIDTAKNEDYQPYLTRANLCFKDLFGKMPEYIVDQTVEKFLDKKD